jgi:hypothetical protein
MSTVFCDHCGASLLGETAKFCRVCGKPTPLSEATTKRFDEQPEIRSTTSPVGNSYTTPAYMAPFEMPPSVQTHDLKYNRQRRNLLLVIGMLVVMILALGGLLAFLSFNSGSSDGGGGGSAATTPPALNGPPPGTPGVPGGVPKAPTPPTPPPVELGPSPQIDSSLIYPGAKEQTSVEKKNKRVRILNSEASVSDVADWYIARLPEAKKVSVLGQTILKLQDLEVVIVGGPQGSQIIMKRGSDGD